MVTENEDLDDIQQVVAKHYAGGDFAHMTKKSETKDCGDGLFSFLSTELSRSEDCDSVEEAVRRLDSAISEMQELKGVFEAQLE